MQEEKREKEGGPTQRTRVGWMEVGVIEEEEGPPTGHEKGASPAACGCHHQAREEEEIMGIGKGGTNERMHGRSQEEGFPRAHGKT